MRQKTSRQKPLLFMPLLALLALFLIWQMAATLLKVDEWLLPAPVVIARRFFTNFGLLFSAGMVTFLEAMSGMMAAVAAALVFSFWLTMSETAKRAVYPLLIASQTIPVIVLAPLFLIWFGYGITPKIVAAALVCFFPMVVNTMTGLASVDSEQEAFYRHMGANKSKLFFKVKLPYALPYFFSGLRVSATYAVMGAVIGEWLGAEGGVGRLLTVAQRAFDLPMVFACILMITVLSAFIFLLAFLAEKFFCRVFAPHLNNQT